MSDSYYTLQKKSEGLYKEKGSKFIAYAAPVQTLTDIATVLEEIQKIHPKSRHVCYAYKLGIDGNAFRINDDGEPSGSAGRPIYNQLESKNITDVIVAVVRYFGGTKLGVPGLINAYKTSAVDAIQDNVIIKKYISYQYQIDFEYVVMGELLNVLKKMNISIIQKELTAQPFLIIEIRKSLADNRLLVMKSKLLNLPIEMITEKTVVKGMTLKMLES